MTSRRPIFLLVSKSIAFTLVIALAGATQATAGPKEFGRCLTEKGATFYGASWCPQCRAQRQLLGSAMSGVRYVECSIGGKRGAQRSVCDEAAVEAYPTWVFADGSRVAGRLSVEILAAKTGCKPPGADATEDVERTDADGARHRRVGGALIIDIPE